MHIIEVKSFKIILGLSSPKSLGIFLSRISDTARSGRKDQGKNLLLAYMYERPRLVLRKGGILRPLPEFRDASSAKGERGTHFPTHKI